MPAIQRIKTALLHLWGCVWGAQQHIVPILLRYQSCQSSQPQFIWKPNSEADLLMARLYWLFIMAEHPRTQQTMARSDPGLFITHKIYMGAGLYTHIHDSVIQERKCEVQRRKGQNEMAASWNQECLDLHFLLKLLFFVFVLSVLISISQTLLLSSE